MIRGRSPFPWRPLARQARVPILGLLLAANVAAFAAPASADALSEGKKLLKANRAEEAVPLLRQAVEADPNLPEARIALGQALERRRRWAEALAEYQQAAKLDERSAEARRGQGATLVRLGRLEEAAKAYEEATRLDRRFPEAALGLGDVLVQLKRHDEAVAVLSEGVKWGAKTRPLFYEGLGRAEAARGNLQQAEVNLLKAREEAPNQARFHRALGDLYVQRKIPDLAAISYQQAIELDPDDLDSRFAMARAKARLGLYNEALEQYRAITSRDSTYEQAYKEMGDIYLRASDQNPGFIGDAIANLENYRRLSPDDPEGVALLARAYSRVKGKQEEALALLKPLATAGKLPPEGHLVYGRLIYEQRQFADAANAFAQAGKRLEDVDYLRFAHSLRMRGSMASADSIYQARWEADSVAGKEMKKASDWVLERGKLAYQIGKSDTGGGYASAIPFFQRKIELDPDSDEAYYYMGLSLLEMQRLDEALEALRKSTELAPAKADRRFWYGATLLKAKREDEARQAFETVTRLDSTSSLGAIARQRLGFYRLLKKDWGGAIDLLEESAQIDPKQAMTWVWLGQASQNSGQRARAVEAYRKALQLDPNQQDAKRGLQQLQAP